MRAPQRGLVSYDQVDGVAVVTLDDPGRRNVLSMPMVDELLAAVERAEREAAALVVTGRPPVFCAGAELDALLEARDGDFAAVERVYEAFLRVARSPLPTIAAVGGAAVGAGLNLALACDLRVAADDAWFDSRFHRLGIHPGGGHVWMLERLVGREAAVAMVVLGERVHASRAREIGLAWDVVPAADLLPRAVGLAAGAARQDPQLLGEVVRTVRSTSTMSEHTDAVSHERRVQRWSLGLDSAREALEAMRRAVSGTKPK